MSADPPHAVPVAAHLPVLYADVTRATQTAERHHTRNQARASSRSTTGGDLDPASSRVDPLVYTQSSGRSGMNGYNCACMMPAADLPPIPPGHVRFVCVSDTHGQHRQVPIPPGDVFIHAGDIAMRGSPHNYMAVYSDFNAWLGTLPHPHKFVIAGNHDTFLDASLPGAPLSVADVRALLSNATYLLDEEARIPLPANSDVPIVEPSTKAARFPLQDVAEIAKGVLCAEPVCAANDAEGTCGVPTQDARSRETLRRFLRIFGSPFSYGDSRRLAFQGRVPQSHSGWQVGATAPRVTEAESVAYTESKLIAQLLDASSASGIAPDISGTRAGTAQHHVPAIDVLITHHSVNSVQQLDDPLTTAIIGPRPVARVHVGGHYHRFYGARVHSTQRDVAAVSAVPVVSVNASVLNSELALVRGAVVFDLC